MSDTQAKNTALTELRNETTLSEPGPRARHRGYLAAATAENTRRAYRAAVRHFERWGGRLPTDRDTLIRYLLDYAETLNPRTLDLRLTALSQWHRTQGFADPAQDPTVRKTLKGIRHTHGRPKRQAIALRLEHMAAIMESTKNPVDAGHKLPEKPIVSL